MNQKEIRKALVIMSYKEYKSPDDATKDINLLIDMMDNETKIDFSLYKEVR